MSNNQFFINKTLDTINKLDDFIGGVESEINNVIVLKKEQFNGEQFKPKSVNSTPLTNIDEILVRMDEAVAFLYSQKNLLVDSVEKLADYEGEI